MRSYFALYPGIASPKDFKPTLAPALLTQGELWEHARNCQPSLLFRVRSESDPGALLSPADRLESCVGLVDAAARWRTVFAVAHIAAGAVRHPALAQGCLQALAFVSTQHPANVSQAQRQGMIGELMKIVEEGTPSPGGGANLPNPFEQRVGAHVASLIQADNDIEAAYLVPFVSALCPFHAEEQRAEYSARMATLETMIGAALLVDAARRLAERAPVWMFAKMPAPQLAGAEEPAEDDED